MISLLAERELPGFLAHSPPAGKACVSIGDPGRAVPCDLSALCPNFLRLEFFDSGESDPATGRERIPELSDAKACIDFYHAHIERDFLVHSEMNVGRAPAVALCFLCLKLKNEDAAKNELFQMQPRAMPNKRLVLLFDHILGSDLRTVNYVIWMRRLESMRRTIDAMVSEKPEPRG